MAEASEGLTRRIARFVSQTSGGDIPESIYEHAKVALLDWYAVTIAGKDDPLVQKLTHLADQEGGNPQATLLGQGVKKTASQATLINGAASHALDYDDTLAFFLGHPSVTLFPSVLALAEWKGKKGAELLTAYVIGFRTGSALGAFAGLGHYMAGWHGTSTMGHLASASACSRLLGLDVHRTTHALGIAATQASGLKRVFGTMCKPFHAGKCSQAGLNSALLAAEGFTSAEDALEGPQGFFDVLRGDKNEEVLATLGQTWDIEALAQKYHASCHATHSPIEAAWKIVNEHGLSTDQIKSITVKSSEMGLSAAHRMEATTGLEGKFSIPYCVANALLRGNTGMQAFVDEKVKDPEVQGFMKKISVVKDETKLALEADVELETAAGEVHSAFSDILQEVPPLEVKKEKLRAKFEDLCGPVLGGRKTEEIRDAILSLDTLKDMGVLFDA
jgi:2-methylcitrate dehydratase PrpD